ncbi:MAG: SDR family NAD(P)-dependent oxidoreductase, partial [Marinobacter sp.]|nr:SDR family NAD(P)-dependent oxidoreductase [Marinobacter sp.]
MNNSNKTNLGSTDWSLRVDGKTALVTGAAGGLGHSFTRCLLEAGATVIVSGRRREALESLKGELSEHAERIHVVTMDVTDEASVRAAFDTMVADIAIPDVVVSNAGVATSRKALDLTGSDWDRVIDTNL